VVSVEAVLVERQKIAASSLSAAVSLATGEAA
jgi:hypothetical protein